MIQISYHMIAFNYNYFERYPIPAKKAMANIISHEMMVMLPIYLKFHEIQFSLSNQFLF